MKVIHMGRAAGKTTKALEALQKAGGGIFITRYPQEAINYMKRVGGLDNITIFPIDSGTRITVDDIDALNLTVTTNAPLVLEYLEHPSQEVPC